MDQINIWGIKINPLKKVTIIDTIDKHVSSSQKLFHLTGVNPETIAKTIDDDLLRQAVNDSDLVNIDNMLVTTTLRFLGYRVPERVACPDIFETLLELSSLKGYSVYFLGAKQDVLEKMIANILQKYPALKIAGKRNGYFKKDQESEIVSEINKANPDMLFIGLPTPEKEVFILNNKKLLSARFAFGVGGAFDVQAGKVVRAPRWMQRIGLEGFHRIMQNPGDYGKRVFTYYKPFFGLFIDELLHPGRRQQSNKQQAN